MPPRRRRREEEEDLQRQKKALKKSYEKIHPEKKSVGTKRISDTTKFILIASVAIIVIIIVAVQFRPPPPICYYTEGDFVHATLDQDTQQITFDHITAWYRLRPYHTSLSCDIIDYFDSTYSIIKPDLLVEPYVDADSITYSFSEETSTISWETIMENGTALQMSTWVNLTTMQLSPSSIPKGVATIVNFKIEIVTCVAVDQCNISLRFNKNLVNTSIEFVSITNGTADSNNLIFSINKVNIPAASTVLLNFSLLINTTLQTSPLNLIQWGAIHLLMKNRLLGTFPAYSKFKESTLTFIEFDYQEYPELKKTNFLDIVIDIPYYKIILI